MTIVTSQTDVGQICGAWHARLVGEHGDAGALAELRRARGPLDVVLVEPFHGLRAALPHANVERLTVVAAVLVHVRRDDRAKQFAGQLAGDGRQPPMNEKRFRALIATGAVWADTHRQFVRAIRLLDATANVRDLATSLYHWDDHVRRRFALEYYDILQTKKE